MRISDWSSDVCSSDLPEVSGGMVVEETHSGRVRAMQGGFDNRLSSYNRATQAMRQPGSTTKPFVYAAALDNGMTPARSDERRVGKEFVSTGRSRGSAYH